MYCKTVIIGNLTRDVELRYTQTGTAMGKSAVAYNTGFGDKKKTNFIDFTVFGKTAETLNQYTHKGSKILLEGEIQFETWTDNQGQSRSKHTLLVNQIKFLGDGQNNNQQSNGNNNYQQNSNGYQNNGYSQNQNNYQQQRVPEIDIDEEDIPF